MTNEELRELVIRWNNKFPFDRFWRMKHNVSFLSPEHRACSFLAQKFEFEEDKLYNEFEKKEQEEKKDPYIPNIGDWLKYDDIKDENTHQIKQITQRDIENFLDEIRMIEGNQKEDA